MKFEEIITIRDAAGNVAATAHVRVSFYEWLRRKIARIDEYLISKRGTRTILSAALLLAAWPLWQILHNIVIPIIGIFIQMNHIQQLLNP